MCDHCKTYKPLLNGGTSAQERPRPVDVVPPSRPEPTDNSCCSWRKTCCDGVCCNQAGSCCSPQPAVRPQQPHRPAPYTGYGYGQPMASSYSYGMTADGTMPDRVPCMTQEKKLPMCFGGTCCLSTGKPSTTGSSNSGSTTSASMMKL